MKQYRVIVTELHSAEYHVDAENADEAHEKVILGYEECVESFYNETFKDRDDAYIVEMDEATTQGDKKLKDYLERQEFFEGAK